MEILPTRPQSAYAYLGDGVHMYVPVYIVMIIRVLNSAGSWATSSSTP